MSASLIGWIWEESDRCKLSTGARLTLFALSEHTNIGEHGDWRVFPSQSRIARMVGVKDPKSIRRYMNELVGSGLVTFAHQHDDHGRQLQNLYWLSAPKLLGGEICPTGVGQNALHEGGKMPYKSLNKNPVISNGRFKPPSLGEVTDYCKERSNNVNPANFIDHYEANGWMRGKAKIKCWKACVRTWERNNTNDQKANYL